MLAGSPSILECMCRAEIHQKRADPMSNRKKRR